MRCLGLLLATACSVEPDYTGSRFTCTDERCPSGFRCDAKVATCVPDVPAICGGPAAIRTSFDNTPAWLTVGDPNVSISSGRLVLSVPPSTSVGAGSRRPFETFDLTRGDLVVRGIARPAPESTVYLNLRSRDVFREIAFTQSGGQTRLALVDVGAVELARVAITNPAPIDVRASVDGGMFVLEYAQDGGAWQPWARRDERSLSYMNLEIYGANSATSPSVMTLEEITSAQDAGPCQPSDGFADDFRQAQLDEQWTEGAPCTVSVVDGGLEFRGPALAECIVGLRRMVDLRNQVVGIVRAMRPGPYILRLEASVGEERMAMLVSASESSSDLSASTCDPSGTCTDRFVPDLGEPWLGMRFIPMNGGTELAFLAGAGPDAADRVVATLFLPFSVAQARLGVSVQTGTTSVAPRVDSFTAQDLSR